MLRAVKRAAAEEVWRSPRPFDLVGYLDRIELEILEWALKQAGGVKKDAAALLMLHERSFRWRLTKRRLRNY